MNENDQVVTNSRFYMWRTLFALAHVDHILRDEEVRYMVEILEDMPFNDWQTNLLNDDILSPKIVEDMFRGISDQRDQAMFFYYARELVHIDGEFAPEEQEAVTMLEKIHIENTNVDDLVGQVSLELDEKPVDAFEGSVWDKGDTRVMRVLHKAKAHTD